MRQNINFKYYLWGCFNKAYSLKHLWIQHRETRWRVFIMRMQKKCNMIQRCNVTFVYHVTLYKPRVIKWGLRRLEAMLQTAGSDRVLWKQKNLTVKIFIFQNIFGSKAVFLLILYLGVYAQRPGYFAPPDHSGFAIFRMFFFNNSSIFINNLVASGDNGLKLE